MPGNSLRYLRFLLFNRLSVTVLAAVFLGSHPASAAQPGTVTSWGLNVTPLVDPGTRYAAIAAGGSHTLALASNGSVVAWGSNTGDGGSLPGCNQSTVPAGLSNVVAIAASGLYSMAVVALPVPSPTIQATLSGSDLTLSWPASAQTFTLQATTNLADPASWTTLTNVPVIVNEQNTVTDSFLAGNDITDSSSSNHS